MGKTFLLVLFAVVAIAGWMLFGLVRRDWLSRRRERAARLFQANRDALQDAFLAAAAASGKPRGLAWKEVQLDDRFVLTRDRADGSLVGLAGATISFTAIPGGDMEEVEAVGNLRSGTAVFNFKHNDWSTDGRAVFNLEPREVLERYRNSLDPV